MPISYTKRGWTNNLPPAINAANLGAMDDGLKLAVDALNTMGDAGQQAVKEIGAAPASTTGGKLVNKITEAGYSLAPATGTSNLDNIGDGSSYARVQKAKADAINGGTILALSGVQFPAIQSASSDPNTLDDYEEGTCTLVLMDSAGHSATMGSNNFARYTKIGNMVFVEGTVNWTDISSLVSNSRLRIAGLPFTAFSGSTNYRSPCNFGSSTVGTFTVTRQNIAIGLDGGNSFMWMTYISGYNEDNIMTISHIGSSGTIYGVSIAYKV